MNPSELDNVGELRSRFNFYLFIYLFIMVIFVLLMATFLFHIIHIFILKKYIYFFILFCTVSDYSTNEK